MLLRHLRTTTDARTRLRYLLIINLINGRSPTQAAQVLGVAHSTIDTVARRFREKGE
jgi:transposase